MHRAETRMSGRRTEWMSHVSWKKRKAGMERRLERMLMIDVLVSDATIEYGLVGRCVVALRSGRDYYMLCL